LFESRIESSPIFGRGLREDFSPLVVCLSGSYRNPS
jgi:hypothetical protein